MQIQRDLHENTKITIYTQSIPSLALPKSGSAGQG